MRLVRLFFYLAALAMCTSCQIIEFPEDKPKPPVNNTENVEEVPETKTEIPEDKVQTNTNEQPVFMRPTEGFNNDNSQKMLRDFAFTNFDTQDLKNPFYVITKFLDAVQIRNFKLLQTVTSGDFFNQCNVVPEDSPEFWRYMQGKLGLYTGITRFSRLGNVLVYQLQSLSNTSFTEVILTTTQETWHVSKLRNIVLNTKLNLKNLEEIKKSETIWQGIWDVKSAIKFDYSTSKLKVSRSDLLVKILADAREKIDINPSANFLDASNNKLLPEFLQVSDSTLDSKRLENKFMINFYRDYKLRNLTEISVFPVTESIHIETYIAVFDININPAVFIVWYVINGTPFLVRFELPTGSNIPIFRSDS